MTRRELLAAAPSAFSAAPQSPPRKPNLLFILADQWRPQTLPAAGDPDLIAPNLARLGQEGVHFTRVYATNPVCTPSRASILTGRYPHACRMPHNNLQLPLEEVCIADQMKKAGYATGYIGKWHLDGEERPGFVPPGPRRRGFDYWAGFNRGHSYFNSTYFRDTPEPLRNQGFEPDYQTDLAVDFIEQNKNNPFYLYLSWGPPHTPRTPPPRHAGTYDARQFHLPPNIPVSYQETARKNRAAYYGLCTSLDDNVGRLLTTLDKTGLAAGTLVVFTADHGDMLGAQGLEFKGVPYEESARIPMLMRYPRLLGKGLDNDTLISNADFMPTFLSLCGGQIPKQVHGRDLTQPVFHGKGDRPESLFTYGRLGTPGEWRMIRRGLDKLVVNTRMETTHLFNLGEDPFEQNNLAQEVSLGRRKDELKAHLKQWMKRIGDGQDPSGLKVRG
ncbi:MAG: sulfatase [Acidobacteriia bacterium]|nr:sulfatase [Terriglobia bacterium]